MSQEQQVRQYCGQVRLDQDGQSVQLYGWAHSRRDHGGLVFIDLRDVSGRVQVVVDPAQANAFAIAEQVRSEYVLAIQGTVRRRPEGTVNDRMATGAVEVIAETVIVLNAAKTPPFPIDTQQAVSEEVRLQYRYLDMRRPALQQRLQQRSAVIQQLRNALVAQQFIEVETPVLTKSTPEGARDYLVPSRTYPGQFFALPQSPQIFKQLLMIGGLDRYFQVVHCFRDEDLRADRQPEFTQLDIELSFVQQADVMQVVEGLLRAVFQQQLGVALPDPLPVLSFAEAMRLYGSDKPDLRIPLTLVDVAPAVAGIDFGVLAKPANTPGFRVAALCVPGGASLPRSKIDAYTELVKRQGAKGLAYIKVADPSAGLAGCESPILKYFDANAVQQLLALTDAKAGDMLFFGADRQATVNAALGALRVQVGHDFALIRSDWQALWVVDFPLFDPEAAAQGQWTALHHPFTAPRPADLALLAEHPEQCLAQAYDLVLNGHELGGGSIRIHQPDVQAQVLARLGLDEATAQAQFGHLLTALTYGAPPHGGFAFGLDRWMMLMTGAESIRDVMAFPKTQTAHCPLTQAPSVVDTQQLLPLGVRVLAPETAA